MIHIVTEDEDVATKLDASRLLDGVVLCATRRLAGTCQQLSKRLTKTIAMCALPALTSLIGMGMTLPSFSENSLRPEMVLTLIGDGA